MSRGVIYAVTSGKGGVGKTTTSANLGLGLALEGKRVALVDGDIGLRNLDVVMGLENRIVYDIVDVVEKRAKLSHALIKDRRLKENLVLLPAAQTRDKESVSPDQMREVVRELSKTYDYVIVDAPAGIEQGFKNAIAGADEIIVVTNPEVSAVRDADRIIGLVDAAGKKSPKLVITRIRMDMVKRGDMLSVEDVLSLLEVELIGIVPEDNNVVVSSNRGEPVILSKKTIASQAYSNIVKRIMGEDAPLSPLTQSKGIKAFVNNLFAKIKGE